uniref:TRP C-terminal domain-containing protein n=1 Tax=Globisporangium ultimum (strain ATCC 200006 / CBS 805.95 / DAOM BR144) TaxID=431595 RepID=K3WP29_GLOUD
VACAASAGILLGLSLLLPYWTKIVPITDNASISASHDEARREAELTLGIWGSCIAVQSTETDSLSGNQTRAAPLTSGGGSSFTCASYYDTEVVGIRCTDLPGFTGSDSSCVRVTEEESASLCSSESPAAVLLTSDVDNRILVSEWLCIINNVCGNYAKASIALVYISSAFAITTFMLLFLGVACSSIESCVARIGSFAAITMAFLQSTLTVFWYFETQGMPSFQTSNLRYGTSFYLNAISILLQVVAFVSARGHLRLEEDADEQLDKEFRTMINEKPQKSASNNEMEGSHKVV